MSTLFAVLLALGDDADLARALAERGWHDLAAEVLSRIPRDQDDVAKARVSAAAAQGERDLEKRLRAIDGAIEAFQRALPGNPREAGPELTSLHQERARLLATLGRPEEAERALGAAVGSCDERIRALTQAVPAAADADWDRAMMRAKFDRLDAMLAHGESMRSLPGRAADMRRLLESLVDTYESDLSWAYSDRVALHAAAITVGRSCQILAETGEGAASALWWNRCFARIGTIRGVLKDSLKVEGVREIALESCYYEIRAQIAYAATRSPVEGSRKCGDAAKLAENLFKLIPGARAETAGRLIRLEQGRALCLAGRTEEGVRLLTELKREDARFADAVVDIVAVHVVDPRLLVEMADVYADRDRESLPRAIALYRRALASKDEALRAHCWERTGLCYYRLGRYWEAVAACGELERPPHPGSAAGGRAALVKLEGLERIAQITGRAEDAAASAAFLGWVAATYPGDVILRRRAVRFEKEGRYLEASEEWARVPQTSPRYGESLFCTGYDLYRHGRGLKGDAAAPIYRRAVAAFGSYLDWYGRQPDRDRGVTRDAVGAIMISCSMLLKLNEPAAALSLSDGIDRRFPAADPVHRMRILGSRVEAFARMRRLDEARRGFDAMKTLYEKDRLGVDAYTRALCVLAEALDETAAAEKDPARAESVSIQAGECYYAYFQLAPPDTRDLPQLEAVAQKLYAVAERKAERSRDDARPFFEQACELYRQLRASAGELSAERRLALQGRIARCLAGAGRHDEAIDAWREITGLDPERDKLWAWEALADTYMAKAAALSRGSERNQALTTALEIYAGFEERLKGTEQHWRLMYKRVAALFEIELEPLATFFQWMDKNGTAPAWDNGPWRTKFEELRAKLREKMPTRR